MFNVQIDGVWHQFPKGTRVIEACEQAGSFRAAVLLSQEAQLAGQLPDVLDRNGLAEARARIASRSSARTANRSSTGCRARKFPAHRM